MKIVRKTGNPAVEEALHKEADLMRRIAHPNVAGVFQIFEDAKGAYLAMEFVGGGELYDRILRQRRFPERQAALLMRQLLRAVDHIHSVDIAHRDLKPENLVLSSKGPVTEEGMLLKVIDFGLSCDAQEDTILTNKVGTTAYMAPQVARRRYSRRCDVWSAGVIAFALLSGGLPFKGKDNLDLLQRVREGQWDMSAAVWALISAEAKQAVRSLMETQELARISAADALRSPWLSEGAAIGAGATAVRKRDASEAERLFQTESTETPSSSLASPAASTSTRC